MYVCTSVRMRAPELYVSLQNHIIAPLLFHDSLDHQHTGWGGKRKRGKRTQDFQSGLNVTSALRAARGSGFLMQIGKEQIKAAWQPINQPSNQTWQLSIVGSSSPRLPLCLCSNCLRFPRNVSMRGRPGRLPPCYPILSYPDRVHTTTKKKLSGSRIKCSRRFVAYGTPRDRPGTQRVPTRLPGLNGHV